MYINEQYRDLDLAESVACHQITTDGERRSCQDVILKEHVLDVYVNDVLTMKLLCIQQYLAELVLGRLLTEGIICGAEDVEGIYICEYGKRAKVLLKDWKYETESDYVEITPSCCTGNHILNEYFLKYRKVKAVREISWKSDWVLRLAEKFAEDTPLHKETGAAHSCYLSRKGEILFQCEDIGRHNALDKVIGYGVRKGINLADCIVYTSGRIPTDMAMKAIRAGIPVLAGKAAVTSEAVLLAEEYGLTLVRAGRNGLKVYVGKVPEE